MVEGLERRLGVQKQTQFPSISKSNPLTCGRVRKLIHGGDDRVYVWAFVYFPQAAVCVFFIHLSMRVW